MSWREFVASLAGSLAWPLAAVAILALFRRQLRALLEAPLNRLKAGPFELGWDTAVGAVRPAVIAATDPPPSDVKHAPPAAQLDPTSPVAAILTSYRDVESEVRALARQAGVTDAEELPADALTDMLVARGLASAQTASAVRGLAVLRDLALRGRHGADLDLDRAGEFELMARGVLYALRTPRLRPRA